jgi:hypothetical protein
MDRRRTADVYQRVVVIWILRTFRGQGKVQARRLGSVEHNKVDEEREQQGKLQA